MTFRIGLVYDDPEKTGYWGGAEYGMVQLTKDAPNDFEIAYCGPDLNWPEVDGYVIGNCYQYSPVIIEKLEQRPVLHIIQDIWQHGDLKLKTWLAHYAKVSVMASPKLAEWVTIKVETPVEFIPCAVDLQPFRAAAGKYKERTGACFIGRLWAGKGIQNALNWSAKFGIPVDFYGEGPLQYELNKFNLWKGNLLPQEVPEIMAKYNTFVFLPAEHDPGTRTILEAHSAGMHLVTNGKTGATWWIQHQPEALYNISGQYWKLIQKTLDLST